MSFTLLRKLLLTGTALLTLSGCGNAQNPTAGDAAEPGATPEGFAQCTAPRPEACIQIYQPVCARVEGAQPCVTDPCPAAAWQTRGNGCSACSDPQVSGYVDGECPADQD